MDYQNFLVKQPGPGTGRLVKGMTRVLKVLDNGLSISDTLPSRNGTSVEYPFECISNVLPSLEDELEFKIDVLNNSGKSDSLKFSCQSRAALLTSIHNKVDDIDSSGVDFPLKKHSHQRSGLVDTVLRVRSASIVKMISAGLRQERHKVNSVKRINFVDILKVEVLSDDEHVVLLYFKSRIWRLSLKDISPFLLCLQQNMKKYLNKNVPVLKITSSLMVNNISTFMQKTEGYPVLYSFQVLKKPDMNKEERLRVVSITREYFIEKCGDEVTALYSLKDIMGALVNDKNPKEVIIEFNSWRPVRYFIETRDDFLASISNVMESLQLFSFNIHSEQFLPYMFPESPHLFYQSECEQYYCSRILASVDEKDFEELHDVLKEYTCNINVGESQCTDARVLKKVAEILKNSGGNFHRATCCCLVLQRLLSSRPCFEAVKNIPEISSALFQCLRSRSSTLTYAATIVIRAATKFFVEGLTNDLALSKLELANKAVILSGENMQQLVSVLNSFVIGDDDTLQLCGILQIFLAAARSLSFEMDDGRGWSKAFENCIAGAARGFCQLFRSQSSVIYRSNSLFLKTILTHASPPVARQFQTACLDRGILLIHMKDAIFANNEEIRSLSGNLVFLMIEGNRESKKLLESILPQGMMHYYDARNNQINAQKEDKSSRFTVWIEILDLLQKGNFETPTIFWNDTNRLELQKFLKDQLDAFYGVADSNKEIVLNTSEMQITYSTSRDGAGSVVDGVHLEILVDDIPAHNDPRINFWKLSDPLSTFQAVLQAMVLGFTPFFGQMNLPEVDLRLAADVLRWIYERHPEDVQPCVEKLNLIEIVVGMLREVVDSDHQVFVFKLVVLILATIEIGGKSNTLRFLRAGGATVLVPLIVLSLSKCCRDKYLFECDGWNTRDTKFSHFHETVLIKHINGQLKTVRVPSGRFYQVLGKAVQDGSVDAKEAIHWQNETVHEKLQLGVALDLLEAIMRSSGIDSNVKGFPPPAACSYLSKEELLCHLVQILLWAKSSVFRRILDILAYIVKVNSSAMNHLYKLGAFEILLWKLVAGDLADTDKASIVAFIRQSHLLQAPVSVFSEPEYLQDEERFPWYGSILRLFLPHGVILKFMSEEADSFTATLNSEHNNPEVIWSEEMRERLLNYLNSELEPYVKFRASDPLAIYIHVPKAPLVYPELSEFTFSAPFYLENLLDTERFPNYQINDPVKFSNSLIMDLRKCVAGLAESVSSASSIAVWRNELPCIHLLLRAQAYLVQRFPDLLLSTDVESVVISLATPALQICLAQTDDLSSDIIDVLTQATTILGCYCKANISESDVPQASLDFSTSFLSLGSDMQHDESNAGYNSKFETAISGALLLLGFMASSSTGRQRLWEDQRWRRGIWSILASAAADIIAKPPQGPSPISFAALSCLKHYAGDAIYCEKFLEQGWYLSLLLLAIPSADIALKAHDPKSALLYSSADVLESLVRTLMESGLSQAQTERSFYEGLLRLIPKPILACLVHEEGPEKFISAVCTELMHPEGIWTDDMRAELLESINDRLHYRNAMFLKADIFIDSEMEWLEKFHYECLNEEVQVEGLFVRGLCSTSWEGFVLPPGHSYIDVMQDNLLLNRSYLLINPVEAVPDISYSYNIAENSDTTVLNMEENCFPEIDDRKEVCVEEIKAQEEVENQKEVHMEERNDQNKVQLMEEAQVQKSESSIRHKVNKRHTILSQKCTQLEKCLFLLSALRECLKHAVKEGRDDILVHFRYSIISEMVLCGRSIPEVQIEFASIVKALAESETGLEIVVSSSVMQSLALQLWKSSARDSKTQNDQVLMSTLEAILFLAENVSATGQAINAFSMNGLLLPVLAIFAKLNPPSLSNDQPFEKEEVDSMRITKAAQLLAAEIVGQLLLAGSGISRRRKLVKDLTFWRTGSTLSDSRYAFPNEGIEEATDMYELLNIIEQDVEGNVEPVVLRTMVLLFPIDFLTLLAREPSKACDLYEKQHWSPRLVWDEGSRRNLKLRLEEEMLQQRDSWAVSAIPSWSMHVGPPLFLRWTLATILENDNRPLYKDTEDVDYSSELYLGGFFIDQFLRNPEFDFDSAHEERFLIEIRKSIVVGTLPSIYGARKLDFDDRRRLLLSLLLLFKLRPPLLLRQSNFDIFFPVFSYISSGSSREQRGLTPVAILLFHCIATHTDIADCMSSDDLMQTLLVLVDLNVPSSVAGFTGTDPRLCSLMLLLRLVRLSSSAVETAIQIGIVPKLAGIVGKSIDKNVKHRAADCLAVMCADKRKGAEVVKLLETLLLKEKKGAGSWNLPTGDIRDEVVDSRTLKHFLQQRYPSSWWVSESVNEGDASSSGPVTIVESSLSAQFCR